MGAKKVAAGLTTAGVVFIAGCGGGGGGHAALSGGGLPTSQQNGKKISLSFTIPRSAPAVLEMPARPQPYGKHRRGAQSTTRATPKVVRKPKYISTATLNGTIGLYIYQGAQLASSQTFTIGLSNTTDFECYFVPPIYSSLACYNTVNIYVPGGSDTFYAATYDSQNRMLSVTPGLPGTSSYGTPPSAINVPYAGTIAIQTYGFASKVTAISPTPCVNGFSTNLVLQDVDGSLVTGPLANPVTVNAGTFSIVYAGTSVGSSYTFYTAPDPDYWYFSSPSNLSGETGVLTASTSSGSFPVNFPAIYSVNETAFVASTSGLYALGLVNGSPTSYPCGQVPLTLYNSFASAVTFTNPVSMSQDGNNAIVVLDDAGSNPIVDVILANDLVIAPAIYVPVAQTTLSSTGGLDVAATPNLQAYVLNSDGTIQRVDYSNAVQFAFQDGNTNDGAIATSLNAAGGSSITALSYGADDYVFASSASSSNLYEVDFANSEPTGSPFNLMGDFVSNTEATFTSAVVTQASSSDFTNLYASFRAFDNGISPSNVIVSCTLYDGVPCLGEIFANAYANNPGTIGSLATIISGTPALLMTNGNTIAAIYEENTANAYSFGTTFSPVVTRIVTSPDGMWAGALQGSTFAFASTATQTPVGAQAGSVAAIWGFPFF